MQHELQLVAISCQKGVKVSINAPFLILLVVSHMDDDSQKKISKELYVDIFKNPRNDVFHMFFRLSKSKKMRA